jgi:NADH:ubiquinone oxidoreductase subunit F (NADH-binding)
MILDFKDYGFALAKAKSAPESIIAIVTASGLKGRGGSGFPAGVKWKLTRDVVSDVKYIVCNAEEGEPGTSKDRVLMELNPRLVFEGMSIAALAVGAQKGFLYLRKEYTDLLPLLEESVKTIDFKIEIIIGEGYYICGEETALIASINGTRCEPRLRPPFPGVDGVHGKPTIVNNVETFANIPTVLTLGAEEFGKQETRLFTVNDKVYERPIDTTVRELYKLSGITNAKAVQVGGGTCAIYKLDDSLDISANVGTGAVIFITGDLKAYVRELVEFFAQESCGKCAPCRSGTHRMLEDFNDAEKLKAIGEYMRKNSLCGMGTSCPVPVLTALEVFPW